MSVYNRVFKLEKNKQGAGRPIAQNNAIFLYETSVSHSYECADVRILIGCHPITLLNNPEDSRLQNYYVILSVKYYLHSEVLCNPKCQPTEQKFYGLSVRLKLVENQTR